MNINFEKDILAKIAYNIREYSSRTAFYISGEYYTYEEFGRRVSAIRQYIINSSSNGNRIWGLSLHDDINTYASIIALWMEGKCYVPLHPGWPKDRLDDIISQTGCENILDSCDYPYSHDYLDNWGSADEDDLAYILFTSGSTGKPKGVPISRGNVFSFITAFWDIGFKISEEDRCLQCFELSFDLSVMSYLIPLIKGACVYTIPSEGVKYIAILDRLLNNELTVALMAPSTINYLQQYFDEISLPKLRYNLFCGEALREDVTKGWARCIPNAEIYNVYGPTEDTIFCTYFKYNRNGSNKVHNGILSIGKTMTSGEVKVLDERGCEVAPGKMGELCLFGNQLFKAYWKNEEKTKMAFIVANDGNKYYKSGDSCFRDEDGDIMYCGRLDHQTKIQGYRVELGEIEFHAREFLKGENVVCLATDKGNNLTEIYLFVESEEGNTKSLLDYLKTKMPSYMIPTHVIYEKRFPLNKNEKIDRNVLKQKLM